MTQLRLQLREAAERDARRGPLRRAAHGARWDGSRPLAIAAAVAAMIAALALVVLPYLRGDEPLPAGRDLRIAADTQLLQTGGWVLPAYGSVWLADPGAGEIVRVDPDTRAPGLRIPVGGEAGLGAADGLALGRRRRRAAADRSGRREGDRAAGPRPRGPGRADRRRRHRLARRRAPPPPRRSGPDADRPHRAHRPRQLPRQRIRRRPGRALRPARERQDRGLPRGHGRPVGGMRLQQPGELAEYSAGGLVLLTGRHRHDRPRDRRPGLDPPARRRARQRRPRGRRHDAVGARQRRRGGRTGCGGSTRSTAGCSARSTSPGFGAAGLTTVGEDAWIVTPGGQLIVVAAS